MITELRKQLLQQADSKRAITQRIFFKNSRNDTFLGIPTKTLRDISKLYWQLPLPQVRSLMKSKVHDERVMAHAILRLKYEKAREEDEKVLLFNFYIKNRIHIRDWGGVDDSAPYIAGRHLLNRDKALLYELAESKKLWDRRIAIVTTWWFIRQHQFKDTLRLAKILLHDQEDLMHKAVGWMLREMGKRDVEILMVFLDKHYKTMPRTMLRYAIEKLPEKEKKRYMKK